MNTKFFDLSKEKQDRMINGAMQVFAVNGYDHASTDDMVKVAGVSKGLWFHYFGSKMGLYSFVLDYSMKYLRMEIEIGLNDKETDYFKLRKNLEHVHIAVMRTYPYMYLFLKSVMNEQSTEVLPMIEDYRKQYESLTENALKSADWSEVDPRILREKVDVILDATVESIYRRSFRNSVFSLEHLEDEIDAYIDMLETMVK